MNHLDAALTYRARGLAVIPLWNDKRKNPRLSGYSQYTKKLPSVNDIRRWWTRWPRANIGIITGYWCNFVALDFDTDNEYHLWAKAVELSKSTWTVKTGRGYHVWFELATSPGKSRMYTHPDGGEVLLRAKGGYVISPPSIHHSGVRYTTVQKIPPLNINAITDVLGGWYEKTLTAIPAPPKNPTPRNTSLRIEDLIEPIGNPNNRGAYKSRCPFHNDTHPSAWVNPSQGRFGCNACWPGQWWDAINVYAMMNNITNKEAFKLLGR